MKNNICEDGMQQGYSHGRSFHAVTGILVPAIIILALTLLCGCRDSGGQKPNIIVFLADDLGSQDLGCYGQKLIRTPHMDALAEQGMRWSNAYSSCPVCSPSRAAILTGKSPARLSFSGHITRQGRHRHPGNSLIIPPDDHQHLPLGEVTLAEALKPAGYTSVCIGKWHLGWDGFYPVDQGFDESVGVYKHGAVPSHFYPYKGERRREDLSLSGLGEGREGEYLANRLTDEAIRFIGDSKHQPFFMYLSHYAVHTPVEAPDSLIRKYEKLVDGSGIDPVYAAMVDNLDWNLGRLMGTLERLGLEKRTILILASDNGAIHLTSDNTPFRLGKGYLYEGGVRVPFIMKWPGHIPPGSVCENRTISTDIFATIMEIAVTGFQPGEYPDSRSLVGDFRRDPPEQEPDLFWYYPHYNNHSKLPGASVISRDYKLIEFYDPEKVELYDLKDDIGETRDLSGEMPAKTGELKSKLHGWVDGADPVRHTQNTGK